MVNAKLDNTLNLALSTPEQERGMTEDLEVGYDSEKRTWELIVKYAGDISGIAEELNARITELSAGYAVIVLEESLIERLSQYEEIIFIEKPRRLYFALDEALAASCVPPVRAEGLNGRGVLAAVIDSGIDYAHPDFRREDGSSRILALWDQTLREGPPPEGFADGTEYTNEQINEALAQSRREAMLAMLPSTDLSGHGTHVAGICAGNGRASGGRYTGVAPESDLIIVKLGNSVGDSFPRTTQLMTAIEYAIRKAIAYNRPMAINISFGNNYGSHNGFSLLEDYISEAAARFRTSIVIGTGNEGSMRRHAAGILTPGAEEIIELDVGEAQTSLNLQIWKNYYDEFSISLRAPSGVRVGPIPAILGNQQFTVGNTKILLYYGEPIPQNPLQEIYLEFIPAGRTGGTGGAGVGAGAGIGAGGAGIGTGAGNSGRRITGAVSGENFIDSGIWEVILTPERIVTGEYRMWLPAGGGGSVQTGFLRPSEMTTLTTPSTALRAISVGAYDSGTESPAYFTGRGYTAAGLIKPDLVAPGVDITSAAVGGGYTSMSGTSMAAPFVAGAAALLMQWGIVNGNDPYLYGEKVKAYLIKGARPLPGYPEVPNPVTGYGALCVQDSLPGNR